MVLCVRDFGTCHSPPCTSKQADSAPADNYTVVPLSGGGQLLVAWVVNGSAAVLAWRAADNATEAMIADSVQMTAATFLAGDLANAQVNQATMDPFQQALQGSGSSEGIAGVRSEHHNWRLHACHYICNTYC